MRLNKNILERSKNYSNKDFIPFSSTSSNGKEHSENLGIENFLFDSIVSNSTKSYTYKFEMEILQPQQKSTAKNILKFANTWYGNDFEECLRKVYKARGKVIF